jgi:hypothetical protein
MWIRKSDEEIQAYVDEQKAKRESWLRPLLYALILTVICLALYSFGYRGGWLRGGVVLVSGPSSLSFANIFAGAFVFVFLFIILFYKQRSRPILSYSASDQLLCRECKQPANGNALGVCKCGGRLEPFAFFNWVEDN